MVEATKTEAANHASPARREQYMLPKALLICVVVAAIGCAGAHFEYGGLSLETDLNTLKQKYPTSIVQGRSAWLSKADSRDDVHFIEKRSVDGKEEIRILFEKPEDQLEKKPASWEDGHYARLPRCETILHRLTETYKQPVNERLWVEERLNHRVRTWSNPTETMNLDCYNIDGKGELLAIELTIQSKK